MNAEKPYIEKTIRLYNPTFGDDRICVCGHRYYRHFDAYEGDEAAGCKYCQCRDFKEAALTNQVVTLEKDELVQESHIALCYVETKLVGLVVPVEIVSELARELRILQADVGKYPELAFIAERYKNFTQLCEQTDAALKAHYESHSVSLTDIRRQ